MDREAETFRHTIFGGPVHHLSGPRLELRIVRSLAPFERMNRFSAHPDDRVDFCIFLAHVHLEPACGPFTQDDQRLDSFSRVGKAGQNEVFKTEKGERSRQRVDHVVYRTQTLESLDERKGFVCAVELLGMRRYHFVTLVIRGRSTAEPIPVVSSLPKS